MFSVFLLILQVSIPVKAIWQKHYLFMLLCFLIFPFDLFYYFYVFTEVSSTFFTGHNYTNIPSYFLTMYATSESGSVIKS